MRNTLLGLPVAEVDLATTALPERVMALARKAGLKAVPTGIEHGTVTVIADGMPFEVTTLRRDVETFGRHATVAFTRRLAGGCATPRLHAERALCRRATARCSIRSAAMPISSSGACASSAMPSARIKEDYLRILRFFRFNAYYGKGPLDADGLAACVRLRAGLEQLSAERVAGELQAHPRRAAGGASDRGAVRLRAADRSYSAACRGCMRFARLVARRGGARARA